LRRSVGTGPILSRPAGPPGWWSHPSDGRPNRLDPGQLPDPAVVVPFAWLVPDQGAEPSRWPNPWLPTRRRSWSPRDCASPRRGCPFSAPSRRTRTRPSTCGDMVHAPYVAHAEDDDWGQAERSSGRSPTTPRASVWSATSPDICSTA